MNLEESSNSRIIKSQQLMIVDDDPDVRELVKLNFQMENHEVIEAETGEEALKVMEKTTP